MQEEANRQAGAGRCRRNTSRRACRNGHRERTLKTRYDATMTAGTAPAGK
ncbi:MAG: hypothetical protein JXA08_00540 [Methanomicrobiaceae archaeon]|nr:hypothetical protein [Methanomicrobiaceae archaeon]